MRNLSLIGRSKRPTLKRGAHKQSITEERYHNIQVLSTAKIYILCFFFCHTLFIVPTAEIYSRRLSFISVRAACTLTKALCATRRVYILSRRLYRSGRQCASRTPAAELPHSGSLQIRGLERERRKWAGSRT